MDDMKHMSQKKPTDFDCMVQTPDYESKQI